MSLLPSRGPETSTRQEGDFEVVGVDEDVEPVLDALASNTAREVLNAIYENPGTPSEIADRLDMSIQKISYHLEKLEEVDLIAVAGTRYSEKGQEMTVYEPPDDPLVLFVGTKERKSRLKSLVRRVVPTIGALGLGSLLVQRLFGRDGPFASLGGGLGDGAEAGYTSSGGEDGGVAGNGNGAGGNGADLQASEATSTPSATDTGMEGVATDTPQATSTPSTTDVGVQQVPTDTPQATGTPTPVEEATEVAMETPTMDLTTNTGNLTTDEAVRIGLESADPGLEPGVAFFLGGLFALTLVGLWWAYRTR